MKSSAGGNGVDYRSFALKKTSLTDTGMERDLDF
jgi:hypothetical protein